MDRTKFQITEHFLFILFLFSITSCGGGSSSSSFSDSANEDNQLVLPTLGSDVASIEDEIDSTNDEIETVEESMVSVPEPIESTFPVPDTGTAPEHETETETETETEAIQVSIGFTNVIPFCESAGQRIQNSIELGMSPEEVRTLVGKPLEIGGAGIFWRYGYGVFNPVITFNAVSENGRVVPGVVNSWDTDTRSCESDGNAFIEAANALSLESPGPDLTNFTPLCTDAGLRIQAYIELGMTAETVRTLLGKPVEINGSGNGWQYGEGVFVPHINFNAVLQDGVVVPDVVISYSGRIRGCD